MKPSTLISLLTLSATTTSALTIPLTSTSHDLITRTADIPLQHRNALPNQHEKRQRGAKGVGIAKGVVDAVLGDNSLPSQILDAVQGGLAGNAAAGAGKGAGKAGAAAGKGAGRGAAAAAAGGRGRANA